MNRSSSALCLAAGFLASVAAWTTDAPTCPAPGTRHALPGFQGQQARPFVIGLREQARALRRDARAARDFARRHPIERSDA